MKKRLPLLTGVLGLVLGVCASVVWLSGRHDGPPPPPVAAEPTPVAQPPAEDDRPRDTALQGRIATLERQLRESQEAQRSAEARAQAVVAAPTSAPQPSVPPSEDSTPLPFPSDAPVAFTPKGFQALVERSIRECGLKMKLEAMDCSEYPCIAWMDSQQERISMAECAPWTEAFGNKTSVVGQTVKSADGGTRTLVGLMALPPDSSERRMAMRRSRDRTSGMLQGYALP